MLATTYAALPIPSFPRQAGIQIPFAHLWVLCISALGFRKEGTMGLLPPEGNPALPSAWDFPKTSVV